MDIFTGIFSDIAARGGELALRAMAALVVAAVVVGVGRLLRPLVRSWFARGNRPSRTRVFTALYQVVVAVAAVLLALTLAFPSVRVVDVLASLGIVSVAVGFAFKDVLENLLAGVLLLLRDPFRSGDQIQVGDYRGTVEGVTVRETLLRTFEGERVLIPNAQVYTSPLEVSTHYPLARVAFRLNFPAGTDFAVLTTALLPVLEEVREPTAPPGEVVVVGADRGALEVEVRVWAGSARQQRTTALNQVLPEVLTVLTEAGIPLDQPRALLVVEDG